MKWAQMHIGDSRFYHRDDDHRFWVLALQMQRLLFCALFLRLRKQILPLVILRRILYNMTAKSSSQLGQLRRFFNPMFANCVHAKPASLFTLLYVKIFFDQVVANLPQKETEIVKFRKTFKIWVFYWKNGWVFRMKPWILSLSLNVANLM